MIDSTYSTLPTYEEVYKEIYELDQAFAIQEKERFDIVSLDTENKRYEKLLEHRLKLFQSGCQLDNGRMKALEAASILSAADYSLHNANRLVYKSNRNRLISTLGYAQSDFVAKSSDISDENLLLLEDNILRFGKIKNESLLTKSVIKRRDWDLEPGEFMNYSKEFYNFISSTNQSYSKQPYFHKFELYKQQAYNWLRDTTPLPSNRDARISYIELERQKSLVNSLYGIMKYHGLKTIDLNNRGDKYRSRFIPHPVQEYMSYLFDLYLSLLIGKPRQIGATTFMGALAAQRTMLSKGFLFKFTAESLIKAQQIFFEKVRPFIDAYPFKPSTLSDQDGTKYVFGKKSGKEIRGSLSQIYIEAPSDTIIASGSPDLTIIEEIGNVDNLSAIIEDGRPTMFAYNTITKRLEVSRQLIGLGTGGSIKFPFKDEWKVAKEKFLEKDYSNILIPIFLDSYSKPGFNMDLYHKEKSIAYGKNNEKSKVKFHQTFPLDETDMFLSSNETIIPHQDILSQINRIKFTQGDKKIIPKYGYFEPIFDTTVKYGELSDVPYKIIGAKFVPCSMFDPRVTSVMMKEPEDGWENRYYQGADPIFSTTGHSKCASAIWDAFDVDNRIACIVNFRTMPKEDLRYNFLQPLLMGLYYNKKIRNLVEINAGAGLVGYYRDKGFGGNLVYKAKIPKMFHSGGNDIGIRKDGSNARFMAGRLLEIIEMYGDNINCEEFWNQLKTYVKFEYKSNNNSSTMSTYYSYKIENPRFDYDDVIDAVLYSYICWNSYEYLTPKKINDLETQEKNKEFEYIRDSNGTMILVDKTSKEYRKFMEEDSIEVINW
jgi:hypothetical protein